MMASPHRDSAGRSKLPRTYQVAVYFLLLASSTISAGESRTAAAPPKKLPPGKLGEVVALGRDIVETTNEHPLTKEFVGNDLRCTSCHLDAGTDPRAATFLGVAAAYPAWTPREGKVITLEDRIANCFLRSMNGTRPAVGDEASIAMAAYITWLSQGQPIQMNAKAPLGPGALEPLALDAANADPKRGAALYAERCAECHGENGLGGEDGPPVWGPRSYNDGAGMARIDKHAAWLKVAMPLGDPNLTDQQALDLAAFVNSHERPKFAPDDGEAR